MRCGVGDVESLSCTGMKLGSGGLYCAPRLHWLHPQTVQQQVSSLSWGARGCFFVFFGGVGTKLQPLKQRAELGQSVEEPQA